MRNLEQAVISYIEPIYRFCLIRLASKEDAEDLSQEILTHALQGIGKYNIRNMDAWIWQIAHNRYARFIKHRVSREHGEAESTRIYAIPDDYNPLDQLVTKYEHQVIFAALHSLAAMYREIMVDYYVHELPITDIAQKHHISQANVKWRLHSGREQIKERVGKMKKVYNRINWQTTTCNGSMDSNRYLHSQIARAICLAAYEKPVTVEEISLATGLPAMFIEDELPVLIYGDAIRQDGVKYMTNFILLKLKDNQRLMQMFTPHIAKMADIMSAFLHEHADEIQQIGFYGCKTTVSKLGYIIVPLAMRKAVYHIQKNDDKLKYGPYPPRKDGGKGWFIVQETKDEKESIDPCASGLNSYFDTDRPERGRYNYLWLGKYFSNEFNSQGINWMFEQDLMLKMESGYIVKGNLNKDDLARLFKLNLIVRVGEEYQLNFPILRMNKEVNWMSLFHRLWSDSRMSLVHLYI